MSRSRCAPDPSSPTFEGDVTAIPWHLTPALRDYFAPYAQGPLPPRLTALTERCEAAMSAAGRSVADAFRDDLIRTMPALRTFALSLRADTVRADDLVQETMAKAWANRARFAPGTNLTAWLFTIMRNQFYSECRRARREVEDSEGAHATALTVPAHQEHAASLGAVMTMIGALPATQRQALMLVGAEGFTYEEAAARLGCRVGTVKSRVGRARAALLDGLAPGRLALR